MQSERVSWKRTLDFVCADLQRVLSFPDEFSVKTLKAKKLPLGSYQCWRLDLSGTAAQNVFVWCILYQDNEVVPLLTTVEPFSFNSLVWRKIEKKGEWVQVGPWAIAHVCFLGPAPERVGRWSEVC